MAVSEFGANEYVTRANVNQRISQINANFPVSVANGGTGQTSLTSGNILLGNGASGITSTDVLPVSKGGTGQTSLTSGDVLLGNGTNGISSISTLPVSKGGTGQATLASGEILLGNGTSGISSTSTLPVSKGGTGQTSLTSGDILLGNGTNGITSTSTLSVDKGGTGATTAASARTNLGIEFPLPIANGGTGSTSGTSAICNLGLTEYTTNDFQANSYANWVAAVQNFVDTQLDGKRKPLFFHAGWQGVGYGCGLAWQSILTNSDGLKFLMLFNQYENAGVKFYFKEPNGTWQEVGADRGVILYNTAGSRDTITLSDSLANYDYVDIIWNDGTDEHNRNDYTNRVYSPNGKYTTLTTPVLNNTGIWVKNSQLYLNGTSISHTYDKCFGVGNGHTDVGQWDQNAIFIMQVRGYKL